MRSGSSQVAIQELPDRSRNSQVVYCDQGAPGSKTESIGELPGRKLNHNQGAPWSGGLMGCNTCIRSEKNPSLRSDACMTAYYARGQPASAWPLAGQPCKVDRDLHTIARAHNRTFFVRLVRALGPHVLVVECSIMCTPIMHSTRSNGGTFSSRSNPPAL